VLKRLILKKQFYGFYLGLCSLLLGSCNYFQQTDTGSQVVRVNDSYLYQEDIKALIEEDTSPEDSAIIVGNYVTRWATQQLLIDRAKLNLPAEQQAEFNTLVENYKNELFTNAYTDAIVSRDLDTALNFNEIEAYYEKNGENFILNEDLVKLRYINLPKTTNNLDEIRTKFRRFKAKDQDELNVMAIQFKNYSMNDSVWVKTKSVYNKIGPLSVEDRSKLLQKDNFLELKDSLNVYFIYVNDVLSRNEQAPLDYASATIREILLNKRKQALIKELEKDITKDAIKNNEFEIYN